MKLLRFLLVGASVAALVAFAQFARAQPAANSAGAQLKSQPGSAPPPGIAGQGGEEDNALEIAPQPGVKLPRPAVQEIPGGKSYEPGEDTASINPNYRPGTENGLSDNRSHRRPYLGVQLQYTTQCYLGMEEHGLEVITVDPNSPASRAGLQARKGLNALGAAVLTAGALIPPVGFLFHRVIEKNDIGGDLIVAVDDHRIRGRMDFDQELSKLKPGDTMYLTLIRPLPDGQHKTIKVAVRVGEIEEPLANAAPAPVRPPEPDDSTQAAP